MCGIAGLYDSLGRADLGRLHHMGQQLRHRGPDDEGMVLIDPRGLFPEAGCARIPTLGDLPAHL